ncbi:MAG: replication-associated recombination protein A [bacterium]|nr:replication-associated recombination protein A [bacterium]
MGTSFAPLAERLRPKTFADFIGQEDLVGEGKLLRELIRQDNVPSMIFWGPPGTGKTTLAHLIARETKANFQELSAVGAGVVELRKIVADAEKLKNFNGTRTILFIDEIHRWNKAQQDALLPHVERGVVTLIGATTENPSFEVISPLLSRTRVFILRALSAEALERIVLHALKVIGAKAEKDAVGFLVQAANGDARIALTALDIAAKMSSAVSVETLKAVFQKTHLLYDKAGDEHYNTISAFIKSLRGSNADAALYYCARMLAAGEDPLFIARRMVVLASEDISNADAHALPLAVSAMQAVHMIGMPEARIILAQVVTYLAKAPKSNASYKAILAAEEDVKNYLNLPIPLHLRNAPTELMKDLGYGKEYIYTHDKPDVQQEFLPEKLKGRKYYK